MKNKQYNFGLSRSLTKSEARHAGRMPYSCIIHRFWFFFYLVHLLLLFCHEALRFSKATQNQTGNKVSKERNSPVANIQDCELSVTISSLPGSPRSSYTKYKWRLWTCWNFRIRFGHSACHIHRREEKHLSFSNSHLCFYSWIKILKIFLFHNYLYT